ncbi:MAG: aminotransferase class I/II-fold pyridoxal phosphate-dependent enzyme [Acidobacteria bacterium]|nr:aminotransferase class I/II-fold pyridoxal phosphate-dependent enzyme [Acidobacteriota bacterium]
MRTKIIYLANPNNPTGTIFSKSEFDTFYQHVPSHVLIILDEAYFEYAKDNPVYPDSMSYRYDNVITLRTFSKSYGLAGVRIGYGFAHEDLIASLMKIKLPFEPSTLANAAGIGAIDDEAFLTRTLEHNRRGLQRVVTELGVRGFKTVPSEANFVMLPLESADDAQRLTQALVERGVIIRSLANFGLPSCVRVSIGTEDENEFFLKTLSEIF